MMTREEREQQIEAATEHLHDLINEALVDPPIVGIVEGLMADMLEATSQGPKDIPGFGTMFEDLIFGRLAARLLAPITDDGPQTTR